MILSSLSLPIRAFIAASAFAGALVLAQPFAAMAQQDKSQSATMQEKQSRQKFTPEHIVQRITHLHDQLQITPAQETAWKDFAQVMRDNAKAMNDLIEKWMQNKVKMTALENLRSHAEMAQAHVQSLNKLIAAFEPLYNSMSAEQKKTADKVFSYENGREGHKGKRG